MTPDQMIYLDWIRMPKSESDVVVSRTTEVFADLVPGKSYLPVETSDGTAIFKCPMCATDFSDEVTDIIISGYMVGCECGYIVRAISDAWAVPYDKHGVLSDPGNIAQTTWFHVAKSAEWNEALGSVIHVGTHQSAMDRSRDIVLSDNYSLPLYLYEVTIHPLAAIDPVVFPDMVEAWNDVNQYRTGDVTRYINSYEDPGSISLLVNNEVAIMRKVAEVHVDMLGTPRVVPLAEVVAA